jgi:hypothetical protein
MEGSRHAAGPLSITSREASGNLALSSCPQDVFECAAFASITDDMDKPARQDGPFDRETAAARTRQGRS